MNIPVVKLPGIAGNVVKKAAEVLQLCSQAPLPSHNFPYPYIAPGGAYGTMWWQMDFSLALTGMRYFDYPLCHQGVLNFVTAQKEDGRIPLWGSDRLPDFKGERLQRENVSSIPKLFDAAWKIARWTDDPVYLQKIRKLLSDYLAWFDRARFDRSSGLYSGVFEETFIPYYGYSGEYAPVDLNIELLHALYCIKDLETVCKDRDPAKKLENKMEKLKMAIRQVLWDPEQEMFFPRMLKNNSFYHIRMASAFTALRYGVANDAQKKRLLELMTDPAHFNWKGNALTSVDMTDPVFAAITARNYFGNPCWSGNVWTVLNENAVRGLYDCGEKTLAAELTIKTIRQFRKTYCEFMNPLTGDPGGVIDYAWSAANCVDMLFTVLFGFDFDAWKKEIRIAPTFPADWNGKKMSVKNLKLPGGLVLGIDIKCGENAEIEVTVKNADDPVRIVRGKNELTVSF